MTFMQTSWSKLSGEEKWRWIPGYEDRYSVSDFGHVRSYVQDPNGRLLVQRTAKGGYRTVRLGGTKYWLVHRLILWAFDRPPEPKEQCRHLDGRSDNNRYSNLCWGSALENSRDKRVHGTQLRGEEMFTAKLTEVQVLEIRTRVKAGNGTITHAALAEEYGVFAGTISAVVRGEAWQHVGGPDCSDVPKCFAETAVCSFDTAREILGWYIKGKTQKQLAKRYKISAATVSYIINRNGAYADLEGPTVERHHRKGGTKNITHEEAVAIREAFAADRCNSSPALGKQYDVSAVTINKIVNAKGAYSYFETAVKRPLTISIEEAQQIHDQYHRDYPNLMDLVEQHDTSFYTLKDIVGRQGEYTELRPHEGPRRTSRLIEREQAEQIRQAYKEDPDVTLADLAHQHHSSVGTINAIMLAKGRYSYFESQIKKPSNRRPPRFSIETAQKILDQHAIKQFTQQQLAQQHGCGGGTIKKILDRTGCYADLVPSC
ncbi:hypothetical protein LCGC14_0575850 [marine sediment metagenome]|uniref:Uncharacterized protein n=1 Tax=marine sediment metagenome TaxID=412755 RepID=A0A0F9S1G4_9ZZZZ